LIHQLNRTMIYICPFYCGNISIVSTLINLSQLTTAIHTFDDAHQTFHLINTIIVPVSMPTSLAYFQYFTMCVTMPFGLDNRYWITIWDFTSIFHVIWYRYIGAI